MARARLDLRGRLLLVHGGLRLRLWLLLRLSCNLVDYGLVSILIRFTTGFIVVVIYVRGVVSQHSFVAGRKHCTWSHPNIHQLTFTHVGSCQQHRDKIDQNDGSLAALIW